MAEYFPGLGFGETLEKFLDRKVRPDTLFLNSCGEVINTVVRLIHQHPLYSIKEVIKGGSLGKGTAVKDHSDVDLLVVINNFRKIDDLREQLPNIISSFAEYLLAAVRGETVRIKITKQALHTLQFEVCCVEDGDWFDVDFLPIIDVINPLDVRRSLEIVYNKMEEEYHNRNYYAKCVARQQVDFVKRVPSRVKDLIRLFKYWNYTNYDDLSSFCIELLVIHIWQKKGSPNNFEMAPMIYDVAYQISFFKETTIAFDDFYSSGNFITKLERSPPYVLDPANPFYNATSEMGVNGDYSQVEERGRMLLDNLGHAMAEHFPGMCIGETLEKFLDRKVRPDTSFLNSCREVINTVVYLIHQHPDFSIKEVIKGGSLGKGTAVRGHSDVDLLVVVNNYRNVNDLRDNMKGILSSFNRYLLAAVKNESIEIAIIDQTPFTLRFKLCCADRDCWFDVDLLPVINVVDPSNVCRSLQMVYDMMDKESYNKDYYSKCLAKQQVDFVKRVPSRAKDVIRLLKYWNYNENVGLSSFCIELMVIHVWQKKDSPDNFDLQPMIYDVVYLISFFKETTITFNDYYKPDHFTTKLTPPYILDPANPFNDAAPHKSVKGDYSRIQERGQKLLDNLRPGSKELVQAVTIREPTTTRLNSKLHDRDDLFSSRHRKDDSISIVPKATPGRSGLWTALGVGAAITGGLLAAFAIHKITTKEDESDSE
ncbi:2'-5'-oligoadenylate synthase 3-like [Mytilus trossulus]|uniref:2'-5'-oligoadenylate synthase 3-like n=1 Tax=Mytilus trossulus TaxID=6551 RepID=UPI003007DFBD